MKLHLTASEFRRLFEPVIPWAGSDDMLPVLTGVHVTTKDGHVVAEATDRFRACVNRVKPNVWVHKTDGTLRPESAVRHYEKGKDGQPGREVWDEDYQLAEVPAGVDMLISAGQLKMALGLFKAPRRGLPSLEPIITLEGPTDVDRTHQSRTEVQLSSSYLAGDVNRLAMAVPLLDGEYPKVASLFVKAIDDAEKHESPAVGFNPKLLVGFAAAARALGEPTVQWKFRGTRDPIVGFIGDDFVGLLMPKRPDAAPFSMTEEPKWPDRKAQWSGFLTA